MSEAHREIQELLADYAEALRDGSIPVFLKSLSREEGRRIAGSQQFHEAAGVVRALNAAGFADKAVAPDVDLFISRVDAKIASRIKKARGTRRPSRARSARTASRTHKTGKTI